MMLKTMIAAGAAFAVVSAPAFAGEWRLNPAKCPDLREDYRDRAEDRRDRRVNRGPLDRAEDRADRREDRRDERVTVCPASAWDYHGRRAFWRAKPVRPAAAAIYWDGGRYYWTKPGGARVTVVVR